MDLPSKISEQIALKTRPKMEEDVLLVMVKSIHEEHPSQPLQTKKKQFKIAVTFLTGYSGTFNVTNNEKFHSIVSINNDDFTQIIIPPGAYGIESLNNEIKRINTEKRFFTEANYQFTIKPNFSTLGSIIEISSNITGRQIAFTPNDSIRDLLGFKSKVTHEEYNSSDYPVDILLFHKNFLECDIAQGRIFKGRRSGIIHHWTMTVDLGYENNENFAEGISSYMKETKDLISTINFELKNENGNLVSFNGQSVTFRLPIGDVYFFLNDEYINKTTIQTQI